MVPSHGWYLHLNFTICTLEKALNLNLFWLLPEIFNFLVSNPETIFQDSQIWSSGSSFLIVLTAEMDSAQKVGGMKVILDFLNSYSFYGNLHASILWAKIVKNFYFRPNIQKNINANYLRLTNPSYHSFSRQINQKTLFANFWPKMAKNRNFSQFQLKKLTHVSSHRRNRN